LSLQNLTCFTKGCFDQISRFFYFIEGCYSCTSHFITNMVTITMRKSRTLCVKHSL